MGGPAEGSQADRRDAGETRVDPPSTVMETDPPAYHTRARRVRVAAGGGFAALGVTLAVIFAVLYENGTAPFSSPAGSGAGDSAAITRAARTYVAAVNSGEIQRIKAAVCPADRARFANAPDGPPASDPVEVESVSDVAVAGDSATATMTVSAPDQSGVVQKQDFPLGFERADAGSWTVCQSVVAADAPR